jgi:nitroimidazol reductase NimA-like FMN-containing flavoprotein (pyridoxamine 5'-phosphate oxidase superfamily)
VIPISYVYSDGKIYLHSRPGGRKAEVVAENSNVCFEIDVLERERWSSVLAFGRARISSGLEAKQRMFAAFTGREMKGHGGKAFRKEDLEKMEMSIWEIDIEEMTGREGIW